MNTLIRAEFLKIRTTRTVYGLLAGLLGLVAIAVVASLSRAETRTSSVALVHREFLVMTSFPVLLFVLVLGLRSYTDEFRHGSIVPTLLANPDWRRVLLAKIVAVVTTGVCFAAAAFGLALAIGLPWLAMVGATAPVAPGALTMLLGKAALMAALIAALGVGLGLAVRHQVAAIVGSLLWIMVGENFLNMLVPDLASYLPTWAAGALVGAPGASFGPAVGAALLAGWTAAAIGAGAGLMRRRDIA